MNWTSTKPAVAGLAERILPFLEPFEKIWLIQAKPGIDDHCEVEADSPAHRYHACDWDKGVELKLCKRSRKKPVPEIQTHIRESMPLQLWSAQKNIYEPQEGTKAGQDTPGSTAT